MPKRAILPDFLIVGAQRSGTTYLHHLLAQHPGVYLPPAKELHYFDLVTVRGSGVNLEDYARLFEGATPGQVVGEATPSYMYFPWVPELLGSHLPGARVVFVLRDPVDRAYSQYWKAVRDAAETMTFERALAAEPRRLRGSHHERVTFSYRDRGFYMRQIERFRPWYPRERMLFLRAEDLYTSPEEVLRSVCSFIGAPGDVELGDHQRFQEHVSVPVNRSLYRRLVWIDRASEGRPGVWRLGRAAKRAHLRMSRREGPYPTMKLRTRRDLAEGFRQDATALAEFLGADLGAWSVFGGADGSGPPSRSPAPRSTPEPAAPGAG